MWRCCGIQHKAKYISVNNAHSFKPCTCLHVYMI
uniref:Uncharacterized protein n=1 Tax=Anguilla anguilla TaxID=7936 RepID=A0A0E9TT37_ANGAN